MEPVFRSHDKKNTKKENMYKAIDRPDLKDPSVKTVSIDDSVSGHEYYCPMCGRPMIRKMGKIVTHHFAHKNRTCDPWTSDSSSHSAWKRNMVEKFGLDKCEIPVRNDSGETHFADIFIEKDERNAVMLFQSGSMTKELFDSKINFFSYANCKKDAHGNSIPNTIIYVFDQRDKNMYINVGKDLSKLHECPEYDPDCPNRPDYEFWNSINYNCIRPEIHEHVDRNFYCSVRWKRPSKIFKDIPKNVLVFFDVDWYYYELSFGSYDPKYPPRESYDYRTYGEMLQEIRRFLEYTGDDRIDFFDYETGYGKYTPGEFASKFNGKLNDRILLGRFMICPSIDTTSETINTVIGNECPPGQFWCKCISHDEFFDFYTNF